MRSDAFQLNYSERDPGHENGLFNKKAQENMIEITFGA